jgi:Rhodanese-like domain
LHAGGRSATIRCVHPLESVGRLRERLGEPGLAIVDCRWRLGEPGAGERDYLAGLVPGAAFLDVDSDLAAPPGEGGRHPLPSADAFEAAVRRAGIGADSYVVALDESGEGGAARLWWLLRHFGHEQVAVLDGGMRAWRAGGGPLRAGPELIREGDFRSRPPTGDLAATDRAATGDRRPATAGRPPTAPPTRPRPTSSRGACPTRRCCSTRARPSATAASASQSTRSRDGCRARSTCTSASSRRMARSCRPSSCVRGSRRPAPAPAATRSRTAGRA